MHYDEDYSFNLVPYVSDEDDEIEIIYKSMVYVNGILYEQVYNPERKKSYYSFYNETNKEYELIDNVQDNYNRQYNPIE